MYTLTLVFSTDCAKVLMCRHNKQHAYNYIGGKVNEMEEPLKASYRELFEETKLDRDNIELKFIRYESVTTYNAGWSMYITAGVLKKDLAPTPTENELEWVEITDIGKFIQAYGNANCLTFLLEACDALGIPRPAGTSTYKIKATDEPKYVMQCATCGKDFTLQGRVSAAGIEKLHALPVCEVFPNLDAWDRESLISGMCRDCQEKIFHRPAPGHEFAWGRQVAECGCCGTPLWEKDIGSDGHIVCPTCGVKVIKDGD